METQRPTFAEREEMDITADDLNNSVLPEHPLENIALCLSGGGFRAASFSLGVLGYLHRVQYHNRSVLESVKFITSTSGGSITNAVYSVSTYEGIPFETFYKDLRTNIDGEFLLKKVSSILKDSKQWTEEGILLDEKGKTNIIRKQRNLINAFAKAYDELLLKKATLATIAEKFIDKPNELPHLEESAFNTTEFNNGLAFYFQVNGHQHFVRYIGNGYLRFTDQSVVRKLKISDILAASSCFPGGFEPMRYPHDYVHPDNTDVNALLKGIEYSQNDPDQICRVKNKSFSLMDGGIVDNMGLNCVLKADKYRKNDKKKQFDLILSCDVTSYFNDPLKNESGPNKNWYRNFTLQQVINIFKYATIFFLLACASITFSFYPSVGYVLILPSLLFSALYWYCFFKLQKAKKDKNGTAAVALKYLDYFLRLPFKNLLPMLDARINSVSKLVGDLFLKQIRRGQYNFLFQVPAMKDRAIANLVYEFSSAHEKRRLEILNDRDKDWWPGMKSVLMPTKAMQQIVDNARSMGTTLWFTQADAKKKDELIATGQFTTCYSLIKYICRLEVLNNDYKDHKDLQNLKTQLLTDWEKFRKDPGFMLDKLFA